MKEVIKQADQQNQKGEAGFTLLETSISLVLLAIVSLGAASCFFYAVRNNSSASDRELSMAVAQQSMEQLRQVRFTDASLTATNGANSTITRAGRSYVVTTTIVDSNFINGTARTKTITVRVTPWSDSSPWARSVDTFFGSVTMVSERTSYLLGPNRAF